MTERVQAIYQRLLRREYRALRNDHEYDFSEEFQKAGLDAYARVARRLLRLAECEKAVLFPEDRIGFMRTIKRVCSIHTPQEFEEINKTHFVFDLGVTVNISSDYAYTLRVGFDARKREIEEKLKGVTPGSESERFLKACLTSIEAVYVLADKYKQAAAEGGNTELKNALENVPHNGASSFYEALVMFRILNFMLWLNGGKHNTVGRFDQYMFPYFKQDVESGRLTEAQALELLEELFISLNVDADLYDGIQQGDNGQSMVLGGCDADGNDAYNALSELCLRASLELKLIDPKINLRVSKNTPSSLYRLGTLLTKQGLGFPQYSNDDIVIPALVEMGYDLRDAREYVVAACWEFIIPGVGLDIPNIDALSFAGLSQQVIREHLKTARSIDELVDAMDTAIHAETARMAGQIRKMYTQPSPFQSILMTDCIDKGQDIMHAAKYNNFGFHGAGLSNAADSFAAVQKTVFDEQTIDRKTLIAALDADFVGYEKQRKLLLQAPKMGDNDDYVDRFAVRMLDDFADACAGLTNEKGGRYRAGTGTAMYYIWYSEDLPATADGRKAGEPLSANYSPSLNVPTKGVLSVIQSFTKPDLKKVCNGGPLTLEFHDTVFRNDEGVEKVAKLVELFVQMGGHQLQLNAINRDTLLAAQKDPDSHRNLIVRVWGWSGYFNELDPVYQNHVIKRLEFVG